MQQIARLQQNQNCYLFSQLPGAWWLDQQHWDTTTWDGWQAPVPLKRCHGCHTVGLNPTSGEFVEPGIGCESCHGPGQWHVNTRGLGRIHSSLDAQVCGQCHTRGHAKDRDYFYPVGYKPGKSLSDYFDELKPDPLQNSSQWWANGRARKRHQEYYSWKQGGHANSLRSLQDDQYDGRYGAVSAECYGCHTASGALKRKGIRHTSGKSEYGITCAVCHNIHGTLDEARVGCNDCHEGGAYYHQPHLNADHVPCPSNVEVNCVNCHMPITAKIGGKYQLHSHSPGIVQPLDTERFGVPNSCANGSCHMDKNPQWLQAAYEHHYRNEVSGIESARLYLISR